jgi:hypothetical protein
MPNRVICVIILLFWTIAAGTLFTRDILPGLLLGPPPDLRSLSQADEASGPTRWAINSYEDGKIRTIRSVGQIITESKRKSDGWIRMTSKAWLDTGELLRGTAFEKNSEKIGITSACEIDTAGNLQNFRVAVRLAELGDGEIMSLDGHLKKDMMEVITRSPLAGFNSTKSIPYQPRGIVQNTFSPLDRMPGLQVGQTWETEVISPIFGSVQKCRVQVVGTEHIIWGGSSTLTLKVVTEMRPISAATWIRPDGLVLRQEIPTLNRLKLILERLADDDPKPSSNRQEKRRR